MAFNREIEAFIKDFVKDLTEKNVAIFAGAGMSKAAGYVNWSELLSDIAEELGLSVDKEYDLVSLAQYHVNEKGNKAKLNKKILEEFIEENDLTENHQILARLPIPTFWTTNYDVLIENALKEANKIIDVKHQVKQLLNTRPKRDVVVYKMHGDVSLPAEAILTKQQYESYHKTHEPFISALTGDLTTKTFLFIGFSFTDPNLDYVLSRLNIKFEGDKRQHYCFIKKHIEGEKGNEDKATFEYNTRKQLLMINDLKRYGIQALLINEYKEITDILKEIERRYRKSTIFISGSAEEYGHWNRLEAQAFIHNLSKRIVSSNYRVVNGFGWGVGSAVITGALEAVYERPDKYSEDQLIIKPFPQFETGNKKLPELWEEYRQRMISLAGISIFIFGNKKNDKGEIVSANGVKREFEIAVNNGLIPIPIAATNYITSEIYNEIMAHPENFYTGVEWIIPSIQELASDKLNGDEIVNKVLTIIQKINK
jgi:hypothetical protein